MENVVTIYFVGLCTHLRNWTSQGAEHRIVLIDASKGDVINGHTIEKHIARLFLKENDPIPLDGVHFRLDTSGVSVRCHIVQVYGALSATSMRITSSAPLTIAPR